MDLVVLRALVVCLSFSLSTFLANTATPNPLEFSGFARVIMGYLDDENAEYVGYDNSISIDQQSLLGLQADYRLSEEIAFTGQVVGYTDDQRSSGLEWL